MQKNLNIKDSNYSEQSQNTLYQVSLLQALSLGDYNGSITIKKLKEHGNTGIGTFNRLNGELIMLDGTVFRATGNGTVETVSDEETTPFAVVTFFNDSLSKKLNDISDFNMLNNELNQLINENGANHFFMIRIDGLFRDINVRSVFAQTEPYKRLVEVLEQQTLFNYKNIEGTIIGLYCPPYMSQLNASGWHLHFISKDKTKGGHILDINISAAELTCNKIDNFQLILPDTKIFDSLDLTIDQSEDIEKIEKSK